jgi:hypothetical protein
MKKSFLALSCLAFYGCGSPSTGSLDSFLTNMATQQCAWEFRCCTDAEIKTQDGRKFMTQADCVPYRQLALQDELYINRLAVKQGRLKVDDTKAQACLAALMAEQCNPKTGNPNPMPGMNLEACANVFIGVTPVGSPCQFAGECVTGAHCVSDALTPGSGVCVPYQEANQICNASTDCDPVAVPLLYCAKQDFKCHSRSLVGGPCAYTLDSAGMATLPLLLECDTQTGNIYCDPVSNTCKQLPTAGQPCLTNPPPGVNDSCDPDPTLHLVCQSMPGMISGVCTGPAKLNQPCSNVIQCDTMANLYCDPTTKVCLALPTLNQSCAMIGQCAPPYFCNFNKQPMATCDQLAQSGQPCTNGTTCDLKLFCDTQTNPQMPVCRPLLADGSPCTSSFECLSQVCSGLTANMRFCGPSVTPVVVCSGR